MSLIAVLDYGIGNVRSVYQALQAVQSSHEIIYAKSAQDIVRADKLVVPGVGAVASCIEELTTRGLKEALLTSVGKKPILGICVGLQMFMRFSHENGVIDCLNIFDGEVLQFDDAIEKVPHIGWNIVEHDSSALWKDIGHKSHFYFVHSFYTPVAEYTIGRTHYGLDFSAAIHKDNVYATQFHPEKSGDMGLKLLSNFVQQIN